MLRRQPPPAFRRPSRASQQMKLTSRHTAKRWEQKLAKGWVMTVLVLYVADCSSTVGACDITCHKLNLRLRVRCVRRRALFGDSNHSRFEVDGCGLLFCKSEGISLFSFDDPYSCLSMWLADCRTLACVCLRGRLRT